VCFIPVAAASWHVRHADVSTVAVSTAALSTATVGGPLLSWEAPAPATAPVRTNALAMTAPAAALLIRVSPSMRVTRRGHERDPVRARTAQAFPDSFDHSPFEAMVSAQGER